MMKINLLPYRDEQRKKRERAFYALLALGAVVGVLILLAAVGVLEGYVAAQEQRNTVLRQENKRLDVEIKKITTLKQEIDSLKARQQAVEDLQADRNQPVFLMDELVLQTPEGIYLKSLKQDGQRVMLSGYAQSNERVSEYLRNLSNNSPWLERPDLIEIKAVTVGQGRDAKRVFDFIINVGIKRPRDKEAADAASKPITAVKAQGAGAQQPVGSVPAASVPPVGAKLTPATASARVAPAASLPTAAGSASAVGAGTAKR